MLVVRSAAHHDTVGNLEHIVMLQQEAISSTDTKGIMPRTYRLFLKVLRWQRP